MFIPTTPLKWNCHITFIENGAEGEDDILFLKSEDIEKDFFAKHPTAKIIYKDYEM